jgi:hypothetical protein
LIERISRESLLAMVARLERYLPQRFPQPFPRNSPAEAPKQNASGAALANLFRVNFYARLAELTDWGSEEMASFWRDLDLYARAAQAPRRSLRTSSRARKLPRRARRRKINRHLGAFADRCAFLLDSSLLERARRAAALLHRGLERKAMLAVRFGFRSAGSSMAIPRKKRSRRARARHSWKKHSRISRTRKTVRPKSASKKGRIAHRGTRRRTHRRKKGGRP